MKPMKNPETDFEEIDFDDEPAAPEGHADMDESWDAHPGAVPVRVEEFEKARQEFELRKKTTFDRKPKQQGPIDWKALIGDRQPPHHRALEQALLACALVDPGAADMVCSQGREDWFYVPAHALIFRSMVSLWRKKEPVNEIGIMDVLRKEGLAEEVGGDAYIIEVSNKVDTAIGVTGYLERVRDDYLLREVLRMANEATEAVFEMADDPAAVLRLIDQRNEAIRRASPAASSAMRDLSDFSLVPSDHEDVLLGSNRGLSRGDGMIIFSSAGVGKSSASIQMAICFALGIPFCGIEPRGKLSSLLIQKEDNDGDVAEVITSVLHALTAAGLATADDVPEIKSRVKLVRDKEHVGDDFVSALQGYVHQFPSDLVFINPLGSYAGCDVSDAGSVMGFLAGLERVNRDNRFSYVVMHHTPKPPNGKDAKEKNWNEDMYGMAGTHALPDWARAVINLKATSVPGKFRMVLAKRGKRFGVRKPRSVGRASDGTEMVMPGEITTEIPIEHSRETFTSNGQVYPEIFWRISPWWLAGRESPDAEDTEQKAERGGRSRSVSRDDLMKAIAEATKTGPATFGQIARIAEDMFGITRSSTQRIFTGLRDGGVVRQVDGGFVIS